MTSFVKHGFLSSVGLTDRGVADLDTFATEVVASCLKFRFLVLRVNNFLLWLNAKGATAGSLDGWDWKEMKILPIPADISDLVQEKGVCLAS